MKIKIVLAPCYRSASELGDRLIVVNAAALAFSPQPMTKIIEVPKLKDIQPALEQIVAEYGHACQSLIRCEGRTPSGFYKTVNAIGTFHNKEKLETISDDDSPDWYLTTTYD